MATTSLSLGEHWEVFIKNEISSGRYGSASEVVRDALPAASDDDPSFACTIGFPVGSTKR